MRSRVRFQAVKVSIFGGFPVENPTNKATGLKALLTGISLSEYGSEGFLGPEKSAQRGSFGDGQPADIRGSFARMSRPKTSVRAVKILEKQAFQRGHP